MRGKVIQVGDIYPSRHGDVEVIGRLKTASLKLMMDLSSGKTTEDLWVYEEGV